MDIFEQLFVVSNTDRNVVNIESITKHVPVISQTEKRQDADINY